MAEAPKNLEFAADVLMTGDEAIHQYLIANQQPQLWNSFWQNLPEEEKWKVRVATYNSGQGCIGDAILAISGQTSSWDEIADHLGSDCLSADAEVQGVWNYLP